MRIFLDLLIYTDDCVHASRRLRFLHIGTAQNANRTHLTKTKSVVGSYFLGLIFMACGFIASHTPKKNTPPVKLKIERKRKSFRYLIGAFGSALFPRVIALLNGNFPFNDYSMAFIVCLRQPPFLRRHRPRFVSVQNSWQYCIAVYFPQAKRVYIGDDASSLRNFWKKKHFFSLSSSKLSISLSSHVQ